MEALISQDFEFNMMSRAYAEFLLECSNGYPEGSVERVPSGHYLNKDQNTIQVNFQSPESVAVFLKLKFGAHLRERPVPKPQDDYEIMKELRKLAGLYNINGKYYKENDYAKIINLKKKIFDEDEYFINDWKQLKEE